MWASALGAGRASLLRSSQNHPCPQAPRLSSAAPALQWWQAGPGWQRGAWQWQQRRNWSESSCWPRPWVCPGRPLLALAWRTRGWTPAGLGLQMTLWVRVSRYAQPRTEMLEGHHGSICSIALQHNCRQEWAVGFYPTPTGSKEALISFGLSEKATGTKAWKNLRALPPPVSMLRVFSEPGLAFLFPLPAAVSSGMTSQGSW